VIRFTHTIQFRNSSGTPISRLYKVTL
jgi:hypothetical protein